MNSLAKVVATWFGCGYWPVGPGTAGSLGAFVLWPVLLFLQWPPWTFAAATLIITPLGIWAADRTAELAGKKDPGLVVVDEVLGQWLTLAAIPAFDWRWAAAAFLLFRLFDIWKPWPARRLESLPGGTGIVVDDLAAGAWGAVVLLLAGWLNR